jgi:hypothetical protein
MTKSIATVPVGIPVLITSAINVSAAQTMLADAERRLQLTLQSIEHWRSTPMVSHVIVCDGSGFDLGSHIKNMRTDQMGADCEVISFTNDVAKVRTKGKGYGEGEIVNYALQHSPVLRDAIVFAKCTGKLWVENFGGCLKRFNGLAAFDFHGNFKPEQIDTRFYIVNKEFFNLNMAALHNHVDDSNGFYLEHAFRDGLKRFKISDYVMCPTPRVSGVSGSMGTTYQHHRIKSFLRDARSLLIKHARLA